MATLSRTRAYHPHNNDRLKGLMLVVGLHIILLYGLMSGMHRDIVRLVSPPIALIDVPQIDLPPPPVIPKPLVEPLTRQSVEALQPDKVVAPDVQTEVISASVVQLEAGPAQSRIAEQPTVAPVTRSTPATETPIGVACPQMVAPEMPRKAVTDGVSGLVRATALIKGGVVAEVTNITGPRVFHAAVRTAMMQYKCNMTSGVVNATQEFNFVLSD